MYPPPPTLLEWEQAPAAPLHVVAWLDERQRIWDSNSELSLPPPPRLHVRRDANDTPRPVRFRVVLHRLIGPATLDAELRSVTPLVRDCYEHAARRDEGRISQIELTLLQPKTAPLVVVATERDEASDPLLMCVSDVLTHEIVRPRGADGPMMISVTASNF